MRARLLPQLAKICPSNQVTTYLFQNSLFKARSAKHIRYTVPPGQKWQPSPLPVASHSAKVGWGR